MSRITVVAFGLVAVCLLTACAPLTLTIGARPGDRLDATIVQSDGHWFSPRVAIVDHSGMIFNANRPGLLGSGDNPVSLLREKLDLAARDPGVKAVILRLNTPGGTVTASDAMYREVRRFRQTSGKPVVVMMMDVAASGGYYLACAGDWIVAYPSTVTGSIGVLAQTITFKPALDRIGIRAEAFTSGPNKDIASPLGAMTDEHRRIMQRLVDEFYAQFVAVVKERRPGIPADSLAMVADGRVMTGTDALRLGVVDQIGDLHDAYEAACRLANIEHADLVAYHRPGQGIGSIYAAAPGANLQDRLPAGVQINLAQINLDPSLPVGGVGFLYLWDPTAAATVVARP